jgi:hypothetical protein
LLLSAQVKEESRWTEPVMPFGWISHLCVMWVLSFSVGPSKHELFLQPVEKRKLVQMIFIDYIVYSLRYGRVHPNSEYKNVTITTLKLQ